MFYKTTLTGLKNVLIALAMSAVYYAAHWMFVILIFTTLVLMSGYGLIASYIAAIPLALTLSMTWYGLIITLYCILLLPIILLCCSYQHVSKSENISNVNTEKKTKKMMRTLTAISALILGFSLSGFVLLLR